MHADIIRFDRQVNMKFVGTDLFGNQVV